MNSSKYTNKLINETSPYLLQHAHNPVNWYPWGDEALRKAKKENKLLLISIGYSACHWCHVMERESFENEEIASLMNERFVCIKVDREERPDVDQIYLNAVQLATGSGGWPLNCFALPDQRPVYGGTYFKPEQWKNILENLSDGYKSDADKFEKTASDLNFGILSLDDIQKVEKGSGFFYEDILNIMIKLRRRFDFNHGGTWGSPKFPLPVNYFPLLRYHYHTGEKDVINHVSLTLGNMADGGIYDHIGGGFARYSVGRDWLVPHFEKMLYDNAQLVSLYSLAYRVDPDDKYKSVVSETLDFIEREMMSDDGVFYSSYDADSDGEEGKYYVWDKQELDVLLKDKSDIFCDYFNVSLEGNWEEKNILNIRETKDSFASKYNISVQKIDQITREAKKILHNQREKRSKPGLDDKILVSWNALMIKGFIDAYNVFREDRYLDIAERAFDFIRKNLYAEGNRLYRNYKEGKATIDAFLDDYALLINTSISLYQATFNEDYINNAEQLTEHVIQHFYDSKSELFFYTLDYAQDLITRPKEVIDNVIPSSNSVMAKNLFMLGHLFTEESYINMAEQMLVNLKDKILENPSQYGNWIDLMIQFVHRPYEVCIVGNNYRKIKDEIYKKYLPNIILAGGDEGKIPLLENRYTEGKTTIYVCQDNVCNKPVKSLKEALSLIKN